MNKSTVLLLILIFFCSCSSIKLSFAKDNYIVGSKIYNKNAGISATFLVIWNLQKKVLIIKKGVMDKINGENLWKLYYC